MRSREVSPVNPKDHDKLLGNQRLIYSFGSSLHLGPECHHLLIFQFLKHGRISPTPNVCAWSSLWLC